MPGMPGQQPGQMPGQTGKPQPPRAAPMSGPQQKKGLMAAAQTNVHIAVNMLEEALPAFGSESPEGQSILEVLKKLSRLVGKKDSSDLVPAEIMQLVSRMPQMGGGTQLQQMLQKMLSQPGANAQQPQQPQMPQGAAPMGA